MISVIIPVYNNPDRLGKSLHSLAAQTYKDFEVILVDDGSEEDIETLANYHQAKFDKLRYFRIAHGGANKARQIGAELASGEYIIFWDSDVLGRPIMLELMLTTLRRQPSASYAYASYRYGLKGFKIWPFDPDRLRELPYIHTTSLIRYKHFPGWDLNIARLQDWDLWLTMLEQDHSGVFIDQYLFRVIAGGSMSAWLPKFAYRQPWMKLLPKTWLTKVTKYQEAVKIIKQKHKL